MTTREAKELCAISSYDDTGIMAMLWRNGELNMSESLAKAKKMYRHAVRLTLSDTLSVKKLIKRQNIRNGRAVMQRGRVRNINMSEAQERYNEAKTYTLEEWQERSYRGHKALAPMFKAHVCEYWGEQDNAYNHPYVREVMADCIKFQNQK